MRRQLVSALISTFRSLPHSTSHPNHAIIGQHLLQLDYLARCIASPAAALDSTCPSRCWSCGSLGVFATDFFCPACNKIQPASPSEEYFRIFSLDCKDFDIDEQQIEQRYKDLQRLLHPDKFATATPDEKEFSSQQATMVNKAYDVLKNPLRRAHYMLQKEGHGACEGMTITDPDLLDYVMEIRAEIEDTDDKESLQSMLTDVDARITTCVGELKKAFVGRQYDHAAEVTTQLRYLTRIKEAIIDKI